jgi:hypothetical protein
MRNVVVAFTSVLFICSAWAVDPTPTEQQTLDAIAAAKRLDEARAEAAKAVATRIRSELDMQKALDEADAARATGKSNVVTQQVNAEFAKYTALKAIFGELPSIGKEGSISIGTSEQLLLATRAGSAQATVDAADLVCARLKDAHVTQATIVPADYLTKKLESQEFEKRIQEQMTASIAALNPKQGNMKPSSLGDFAATAIAAKFAVGVVQEFSKLFRVDRTIAVKDDSVASRRQLFEWVLPTACVQNVIAPTTSSYQYASDVWSRASKMATEVSAVDENIEKMKSQKNDAQRAISHIQRTIGWNEGDLAKRLECANDNKTEPSAKRACVKKVKELRNEIDGAYKSKAVLQKGIDDTTQFIEKITPWLAQIAANPALITQAAQWLTIDDAMKGRDWFSYELDAQDVQQTVDGSFTGKRLFGSGSVEVRFKAMGPNGLAKTSGFVSVTSPSQRLDLDARSAIKVSACRPLNNVTAPYCTQ